MILRDDIKWHRASTQTIRVSGFVARTGTGSILCNSMTAEGFRMSAFA